jgi:NADH-quinone oxidoreductase subunit A
VAFLFFKQPKTNFTARLKIIFIRRYGILLYLAYFCISKKITMQFYFLRLTEGGTMDYLPIVLQLVFAIGFVGTMIGLSSKFGPKRNTTDKLANFESGIEIKGNARQPMAIKYFLIAILFVLFDVEVIFFYPYAVNFKEFAHDASMKWHTFLAVLLFVGCFLAGFTYIFKKGAFKWED